MKKISYILVFLGALTACSKKNDNANLPQHNIVAEVELGINSTMTIMETANGKTSQVYNGSGDNPYKFTAPVGAQLKITVAGSYDVTSFDRPDLLVTDNGATAPGIQNNYSNDGSFNGQVTFTIQK